jgi:hypothetical protein
MADSHKGQCPRQLRPGTRTQPKSSPVLKHHANHLGDGQKLSQRRGSRIATRFGPPLAPRLLLLPTVRISSLTVRTLPSLVCRLSPLFPRAPVPRLSPPSAHRTPPTSPTCRTSPSFPVTSTMLTPLVLRPRAPRALVPNVLMAPPLSLIAIGPPLPSSPIMPPAVAPRPSTSRPPPPLDASLSPSACSMLLLPSPCSVVACG